MSAAPARAVPVTEQLARLGVGRLVIIDPDRIEVKNLNRILNATMEDARAGRFKVDVLARAIRRMGLGTEAVPLAHDLCKSSDILLNVFTFFTKHN